MLIPKAMAQATVSGLPVEVGIYTAFVPMPVYTPLGRERMLFNLQTAVEHYYFGYVRGVNGSSQTLKTTHRFCSRARKIGAIADSAIRQQHQTSGPHPRLKPLQARPKK